MQTKNLAFVLDQATDKRQKHPVGKAIAASIEVGTVFPSKLRSELESAGYTLVEDKAALSEYGFASTKFLERVIVADADGNMVAMGAAADRDEAILAAVLGWCRENALEGSAVPGGLAPAPGAPVQ
jgi:hypothetical protein